MRQDAEPNTDVIQRVGQPAFIASSARHRADRFNMSAVACVLSAIFMLCWPNRHGKLTALRARKQSDGAADLDAATSLAPGRWRDGQRSGAPAT
jgi:hypothetical protein